MTAFEQLSVDKVELLNLALWSASKRGKAMANLLWMLLTLMLSMALALPAAAAPILNYTLTPLTTGTVNASWQLPQNPTPDGVFGTPPSQFVFTDVNINLNGTPDLYDIYFFSAAGLNPGGFCIGDAPNSCSVAPIILLMDNIELYSGPPATPTMLTGTFFFSTPVTNERYQLDIVVAPNGVVPEPGILAMLMIGFGLLGAMRQRSFIVAA